MNRKEGEIAVDNVIKEYLVGLGFDVDMASYMNFNKVLDSSEMAAEKFGLAAISTFAKASAAFASFAATVITGMTKLIEETADADLEFQKFGRQMLTTTENAKTVKMSLDALGVTLDDLWLSPELLDQFRELRQVASEMEPPEDFKEQMQFIRSIKFEIARARLQLYYAMQWVSYYLIKYLRQPLEQFRSTLQRINELIKDKMPQWTKALAQFASWFFRLFNMIVGGGVKVLELMDKIPDGAKKMLLGLMALAPLLSGNPFFMMIALITTLLLLLEDFYTYTQGGESALGGFWDKITKVGKEGSEVFSELFGGLQEELGEVATAAQEALTAFLALFGIDNAEDFKNVIGDIANFIGDRLVGELQNVVDLLKFIKETFDYLDDMFEKMEKAFPVPENAPWDLDNIKERLYGPSTTSFGIGRSTAMAPRENKVDVTNSPTFNIYGSDPYATANNANSTMEKILIRSLRGRFA